MLPNDPDALLTRDQVAAALTAAGFPISPKTLATKAVRGGGPPYQNFGNRRSLYRWGPALNWAQARLSPLCGSQIDRRISPSSNEKSFGGGRAHPVKKTLLT
jgi:hypothetical protein